MVEIYTDGSCKHNPGIGSYGYIVYIDNRFIVSYLINVNSITTNNIMELRAVLDALKFIYNNKFSNCTIFTDSQYVNNGLNTWIHSWIKNGWKTSEQKPIMNQGIWEELWLLYNKISTQVTIKWIRAHTNNTDIHSIRNDIIDVLIRSN